MLLSAGLYDADVGIAEAIYRVDWHIKRIEREKAEMEAICRT